MSKFNVTKTPIEGLLIIEPTVCSDKRGFSMDTYSKKDFQEIGIDVEFVEDRHTRSARGILSGLHFQRENPQGMLVRAITGAVLDVAVDLRPGSFTYGASHSVELSEENMRMFWIPAQFAHGYVTLERNTELLYKFTEYFNPASVTGVLWSDPILSIDWEFERYSIDEKYLNVSDKDKKLPTFRSLDTKTLWK